MTMAEPTCINCKYFRITTKAPPIKGECHYNPPISASVFHQGDQISSRVAVWPLVRDIDFCAMFEAGQAPVASKLKAKTITEDLSTE
jgi:hypothetical protein